MSWVLSLKNYELINSSSMVHYIIRDSVLSYINFTGYIKWGKYGFCGFLILHLNKLYVMLYDQVLSLKNDELINSSSMVDYIIRDSVLSYIKWGKYGFSIL